MCDFMVLTFEKIREVYWNEKDNQTIQELPKNFFSEVSDYLKRDGNETVKNIIEDLLNRRERKILSLSLTAMRTNTFPVSNLTEDEKLLFESILKNLNEFRKSVFKDKKFEISEQKEEKEEPKMDVKAETGRLVLINENLPCFVGPDLKTYRLKKGDKIYLPNDLLNLLMKNNYCEVI